MARTKKKFKLFSILLRTFNTKIKRLPKIYSVLNDKGLIKSKGSINQ